MKYQNLQLKMINNVPLCYLSRCWPHTSQPGWRGGWRSLRTPPCSQQWLGPSYSSSRLSDLSPAGPERYKYLVLFYLVELSHLSQCGQSEYRMRSLIIGFQPAGVLQIYTFTENPIFTQNSRVL